MIDFKISRSCVFFYCAVKFTFSFGIDQPNILIRIMIINYITKKRKTIIRKIGKTVVQYQILFGPKN